MSDHDDIDFSLKKKNKKRKATSALVLDEDEAGSSILADAPPPIDASNPSIPQLAPMTENLTTDPSEYKSNYVKKQRPMDENVLRLVQLSAPTVPDPTTPPDADPHDDYVSLKRPTNTMQAKAAGTMKTQTSMDYAADICKDYKLYGYCRWGDECKFIHDRSERKSGNQLDQEWTSYQDRRGADRDAMTILVIPDDDRVPERCEICGSNPIQNPISTQCKHFFCRSCAINRFSSGKTACFACAKETNGRFSNAENEIQRRMQQTEALTIQHKLKLQRFEELGRNGDSKALLKGRY